MTVQDIHNLFKSYGKTLGAAESFTGGLFASEITSIPGASAFFKGSLVTYATETKQRILGISNYVTSCKGVVSQECAGEMASHAMNLLNVDYAIAFTGNAGPEAMEDKPVGEVYIAVAMKDTVRVFKYKLEGDRKNIQNQALELGYQLLSNCLEEFK